MATDGTAPVEALRPVVTSTLTPRVESTTNLATEAPTPPTAKRPWWKFPKILHVTHRVTTSPTPSPEHPPTTGTTTIQNAAETPLSHHTTDAPHFDRMDTAGPPPTPTTEQITPESRYLDVQAQMSTFVDRLIDEGKWSKFMSPSSLNAFMEAYATVALDAKNTFSFPHGLPPETLKEAMAFMDGLSQENLEALKDMNERATRGTGIVAQAFTGMWTTPFLTNLDFDKITRELTAYARKQGYLTDQPPAQGSPADVLRSAAGGNYYDPVQLKEAVATQRDFAQPQRGAVAQALRDMYKFGVISRATPPTETPSEKSQ